MCFDIGEQMLEFASSCFGMNSEFGIVKDAATLPQKTTCIKGSKTDTRASMAADTCLSYHARFNHHTPAISAER
jgi:hypothetical protein